MQIISIISPLAAIAGLVSAAGPFRGVGFPNRLNPGPVVFPSVAPNDRENIGRISDPVAHSSRKGNIAKRADAGFYFCTNAEYTGLCFRDQSPFGTCVTVEDDLASVPDQFGDTVSSVSVNLGSRCTLFRDARCEGPTVTVEYPGSHDLYFEGFNDIMSSFRCEAV
ncbi:hypothetical protein MMC07_006711 [Pseudocyphellaria aurata]|nr:hypothetical protein [Pseudocyphellaria aurata]